MKQLLYIFSLIMLASTFSCSGGDDSELSKSNYIPVIYAFFPDRTIINTKGSAPDSTALNVSAEDVDGEITTYEFEIVMDESGGSLKGDDTANGKIYEAGTLPGFVTIKVTVIDNRGSDEFEVVTFEVREAPAVNTPPAIAGFTAGYKMIFPYSSRRSFTPIFVDAADADGDTLTYSYKIVQDGSNGYLTGNDTAGEKVYWAGAMAGTVQIMATVTDTSGAKDEELLTIYVKSEAHLKISDTEGNFTGTLVGGDNFGGAVASIGDIDDDGINDIAAGAPLDNDGGAGKGAVWIMFLNNDSTVKAHQKISDTEGEFTGVLDPNDFFGWAVTGMGDLDDDGINDIAVSARDDDDGGADKGAVYILFLNNDGTVKSHQKISNIEGNFIGGLDISDRFGWSAANIGDLDEDGINDIAVGATFDDDGGSERGAVWILFLNSNGTVRAHQKISDIDGGFTGLLDNNDIFGSSLANMGDIDGDGVNDIAVGSYGDADGGGGRGAVWIIFLNIDGTAKGNLKISDISGNFTGVLDDSDCFGFSVTNIGDLDGNGINDIAVGAVQDDDGGTPPNANRGAVWILLLNAEGTVKGYQKISYISGNLTGILEDSDSFGWSLANIGDIDFNGISDVAVGAILDDDGGNNYGAVWLLMLDQDGTVVDVW